MTGPPAGSPRGTRVALVAAPRTAGQPRLVAVVGEGVEECGTDEQVVGLVERLERERSPRWTWWSAAHDAAPIVAARVPLARCWDVAEAHRVLAGGWEASPQLAWAHSQGLDPSTMPAAAVGDLFDFGAAEADTGDPDSAVRTDGYLRPEAGPDGSAGWAVTPSRLVSWARAALDCAAAQEKALSQAGPRGVGTAHSESAASLLCVELERDGLPLDRATAEQLIAEAAGPRPEDERQARAVRAQRDMAVLRLAPGRESTDLRNPVQVRELLASVGVDVPNTRKWVLEPFRDTHPLVAALLEWRKAERIATTYGYAWLEDHVGADDRLRGAWTACDGAAGRMTAQNGLHNLPASLRPAVAAHPGHVFVRADLGQIEPRVLAAVSGDRAFAAATRADDLYAPVAATLGVERPVAKVAVLAAMYGQRSGAAGEALKGLERAYPTAMAFLDQAYAAGARGRPVRTFGGRTVPMGPSVDGIAPGTDPARDAARGRFARNAVIQGAAAELFKAWAATVRATTRDLGAQIVLCLHDELLVHVPGDRAEECLHRVVHALDDSARRWTGSTEVRFVADASIVTRWSDAKE
ncbi:DNA polymerase [Knoellia sp. 3-2P3]|uniref:DNA polymerase n=1 Tax=unclassified Knoellia TaxID=2618719 RepID=UPI0023DC8973|nr:DNA polymerase [Knoellia sp. 3-2P3]MDF2092507.1 DNA polymerase [Knoellia sp. 3-2P3]